MIQNLLVVPLFIISGEHQLTMIEEALIKKVSIGYVAGDTTKTPSRDITYSVIPRAIKSYTDNVVTNLSSDIGASGKYVEVNDTRIAHFKTWKQGMVLGSVDDFKSRTFNIWRKSNRRILRCGPELHNSNDFPY